MAFPRSQRFVERESYLSASQGSIGRVSSRTIPKGKHFEERGGVTAQKIFRAPPPTAYSIPSVFDEASAWAKRYSIDNHCLQCKNNDHSIISHKYNEAANEKDLSCSNGRVNTCCTQKKDGSAIPRLKKNMFKPTEGKAPSFMTRPRHSIHNCFIQSNEDNRYASQQYNYSFSPTKKSKPIRENDVKTSEDTLDDSPSPKFRIRSRIPEKNDSVFKSDSEDVGTTREFAIQRERKDKSYETYEQGERSTGAIPKSQANISDDMKQVENIEELEGSLTEYDLAFGCDLSNINTQNETDANGRISEKDNSLQKEFVLSFDGDKENNTTLKNEMAEKVIDETVKRARLAIEKVLKIRREIDSDLSPDIEGHIRFLITDQFIDDEYDAYIKLFSLEDLDWFQICKSVVSSNMKENKENNQQEKIVFKTKQNVGSRKVTKLVRNEYRRLARREKKHTVNGKTWSDIESIVRTGINNLKDEFKSEIYKSTAIKIDALMSKLGKVLLNAENNIEKKCEITTGHLVKQLETVMHK